ncbi:MAG TPA: hypothetical protein VI072_00565 [Polyangiaceae bacterium]
MKLNARKTDKLLLTVEQFGELPEAQMDLEGTRGAMNGTQRET